MALFIFIVGLAIGSFIDASVWRMHEQEERKEKVSTGRRRKKEYFSLSELNIIKGRSMCEHCGHRLGAKDLVPLFSWLGLKGRCRYCQAKLSWEYPAVELATGLLFAISLMAWSFDNNLSYVAFGFWLVFLSALMFLAIYDLKWLMLPNKVVYPLIVGAIVLLAIQSIYGTGLDDIKDGLLGLVFMGGIFYLLFVVSRGKWIGGGDVKLGAFIGILLGLSRSVLAFVLAFDIAALVILPLLALKIVKRKTPIPFGPFLILATVVSMLYGYQIIEWYSNQFLYGLI